MIINLIDGKWLTSRNTRVKVRLNAEDFHIGMDYVEGLYLHVVSNAGKFNILFDSSGYVETIVQTNYGATPDKCGVSAEVMQFEIEPDRLWATFFRQDFAIPHAGSSEQAIGDQFISKHYLNLISDKIKLVPKEWIEA